MYLDVVELRNFYASLHGRIAARHVGAAISRLGRPENGARILGFGFATPYLNGMRANAERVLAFMPAGQGVLEWPCDGRSATALVEEDALPLPDASMDWVYLVHALEMSPRPQVLLREIRRVLTGSGRLIVVATNRQSPWARSDASPFGYGRPYSRGQMRALLGGVGMEPEDWTTALHMPPTARRSLIGAFSALEKAGARLWPAFGGVNCVRAAKRAGQFAPIKGKRVLAPAFAPALGGAQPVRRGPLSSTA